MNVICAATAGNLSMFVSSLFNSAIFSKTFKPCQFASFRRFHAIIYKNRRFSVAKKFSKSLITNSAKCNFSDKQSFDNQVEDTKHDTVLQDFLNEIKKDFGDNPQIEDDTKNIDKKIEFSRIEKDDKSEISQSVEEKFQQYRDEDAEIIISSEEKSEPVTSWKQKIVEVEAEEELYLYQEKTDKLKEFFFERGKTGAFDIEELVEILREEKVYDIAVIKIPPSVKYCDYMVLATARSKRHLQAVVEFIRRIHKKKKLKSEPYLKIEGETSMDWKVLDMINIVLHIFLPETRNYYDIECLWTVGEKYDTLCNKKEDSYEDLIDQHMEFLKQSEPLIDFK